MKHHETPWNIIQSHETSWNTVKHHEIAWNSMKMHETSWNTMKHHTIAWNMFFCSFQDVFSLIRGDLQRCIHSKTATGSSYRHGKRLMGATWHQRHLFHLCLNTLTVLTMWLCADCPMIHFVGNAIACANSRVYMIIYYSIYLDTMQSKHCELMLVLNSWSSLCAVKIWDFGKLSKHVFSSKEVHVHLAKQNETWAVAFHCH